MGERAVGQMEVDGGGASGDPLPTSAVDSTPGSPLRTRPHDVPRKGGAHGANRDAGSGTRLFAVSPFAPIAEGRREDDEIGSVKNCLVSQLETRNDCGGGDAGHHAPRRLAAPHGSV